MTKREIQNKYIKKLRENSENPNPVQAFRNVDSIYNDFLADGGNAVLWGKVTDIMCREDGMHPDNMMIPR